MKFTKEILIHIFSLFGCVPLCFPAKFGSCASDETMLHLTECGAWHGSELLELMKKRYEDFLYLFLVAENPPLVKYYERLGFEKLGERA